MGLDEFTREDMLALEDILDEMEAMYDRLRRLDAIYASSDTLAIAIRIETIHSHVKQVLRRVKKIKPVWEAATAFELGQISRETLDKIVENYEEGKQ